MYDIEKLDNTNIVWKHNEKKGLGHTSKPYKEGLEIIQNTNTIFTWTSLE